MIAKQNNIIKATYNKSDIIITLTYGKSTRTHPTIASSITVTDRRDCITFLDMYTEILIESCGPFILTGK